MASMMDEMAKTLARRRAAAEKKQPEQPSVCKHPLYNLDIRRLTCIDRSMRKGGWEKKR